ncbi:MAG: hypothetical protein L3K14_05395 [Thermoplasmata archaeon]|nr:hypothetical protein [Thermoplasmata archaeon]
MIAPTTTPTKFAAGALVVVGIFLAVSVLLFLAIWFAVPWYNHYLALTIIGLLSLVFAVVSYFGQAITSAGGAFQALSWGYLGLGFALLIGSILLLGPTIGLVLELVGLLLLVVLIGLAGAFAVWRRAAVQSGQQREARRDAWRASNPRSAFDYTTARPSVPSSGSTPPADKSSTPPPGVRE